MTRVLVTGAGGFVGSAALPLLLERGYEVHAVGRRAPPPDAPPVSWHRADLLDPGAAAELVTSVRPSLLLHLAWTTEPGVYWHSPENFRWVEASLSLFRAFAAAGGERAVVAGTCAEYDWSHGRCSETETPLAPSTPYGACKHGLAQLLQAYADLVGVSLGWARIFFLYGPREHPGRVVAAAALALLRGEPFACSEGLQARDFLHVDDVASALVQLVATDAEGAVNVGSGTATPLRDLLLAIGAATDRPDLLRFGELAAGDEAPLVVAEVERLRHEVGWRPSLTLEEGIERTVEWWRSRVRESE